MTVADAFTDALRPHTDHPDENRHAIQRTQTVLAETLKRLVPAAQIKLTGWFNHSFVPDAVLRFADGERRDVYLRLEDCTDEIFAKYSIAYTGAGGPIFVCIGSDDWTRRPVYDLSEVEHGDRCLIVPLPGLEALVADPTAEAEQVLRRGVGYLDADLAAAAAAGDLDTLAALLPVDARDVQLRLA